MNGGETSERPHQCNKSRVNDASSETSTHNDADYDDEDPALQLKPKSNPRKRGRAARPAAAMYGVASRKVSKPNDDVQHDEDDEDDAPLPEEDESTLLSNTRAHELKQQFLTSGGLNITQLPPQGGAPKAARSARRQAVHDPENHDIKTLRTKHQLSWAEIARILNAQRVQNGGLPNLTEAGVYGRFVRNAPRIAAQQGDDDFDYNDYMHLKQTNTLDNGYGPGTPGATHATRNGGGVKKTPWLQRFDEALVTTCADVKGRFWSTVAEDMTKKTGRKFTAEACAERFGLL